MSHWKLQVFFLLTSMHPCLLYMRIDLSHKKTPPVCTRGAPNPAYLAFFAFAFLALLAFSRFFNLITRI